MNATEILQSIGLKPEDSVLNISDKEAVERLLELIEEWELSIKVEDISKRDWDILLDSYADAIIAYHPENYHQERAVFLKNEKMLKKYGLTDEDIRRLDFC